MQGLILKYRGKINLFILFLILIVFNLLLYKKYLNHYFVGPDTLTLIDTSRISSFQDFVKIFTTPLMHGSSFSHNVKLYRPISVLSFSLDYAVWGLQPFGYNLTSLLLHIFISILVFYLAYGLVKGNMWIPFLSALIFSIHPVLLENVIHTAQRQDILASFFLLLSFIFFQNYQKMKHKKLFISFSLLFFLLGLGSKEFAIIFPFIIWSYLFLFQREMPKSQKFKILLPYFVLTIIFILLRTIILHGMIGKNIELDTAIREFFYATPNFLIDLLYSLHYLKKLFLPEPKFLEKCVSLVILALLMATWSWFLKKKVAQAKSTAIKRITLILLIFLIVNTLSMFLFPFYSHYFYNELHAAYFGTKPSFLSTFIKGKSLWPYRHYVNILSTFFFSFFSTVQIFLTIALILIQNMEELRSLAKKSINFSLSAFLTIWMALPLLLYILTFSFAHRTMYFSIIPFSIILSYTLINNLKNLIKHVKELMLRYGTIKFRQLFKTEYFPRTLLALSISSSLIYFSPLFQNYDGWKIEGNFNKLFFDRLSVIYPDLPQNAEIEIYNLPYPIYSLKNHFPPTVDFSILNNYTIKSWLNLHFPDNHIQVKEIKYIDLPTIPEDIVLKVERKANDNAIIVVQYKF